MSENDRGDSVNHVSDSKKVFEQLRKLVSLPANCRWVRITCGLNESPIVETVVIGVNLKTGKPEEVTKRFGLVEQ
jgi:hypothetical protein